MSDFNYEQFSPELLNMEIERIDANIARLQEQKHDMQLALGKLALERINNDQVL